jgi:hypothetical protein
MAESTPLERVQQLRQQGQNNSQIIDTLQREGLTSSQIFDALSQQDIPNAGTGLPDLPPMPGMTSEDDLEPPAPPSHESAPPHQPMPSQPAFTPKPTVSAASNISNEEYIEAIIDEKWAEIENDIQKIVEWKNRSEQRIQQLSQSMTDLKDRFDKLHAALIGKIESYDRNILEVGAEIKAMEKVFSKVLPVFTENVKQLTSVTDRISRQHGEEPPASADSRRYAR